MTADLDRARATLEALATLSATCASLRVDRLDELGLELRHQGEAIETLEMLSGLHACTLGIMWRTGDELPEEIAAPFLMRLTVLGDAEMSRPTERRRRDLAVIGGAI